MNTDVIFFMKEICKYLKRIANALEEMTGTKPESNVNLNDLPTYEKEIKKIEKESNTTIEESVNYLDCFYVYGKDGRAIHTEKAYFLKPYYDSQVGAWIAKSMIKDMQHPGKFDDTGVRVIFHDKCKWIIKKIKWNVEIKNG